VKLLTIEKLIEIMNLMPQGYTLLPNALGNLTVLDENEEYVGFIDFGDEEFVPVPEGE